MQAQSNQPCNELTLNALVNDYLHALTMIRTNNTSDPRILLYRKYELTNLLKDQLMKQLFPIIPNIDMKLIQQPVILFLKFQIFYIQKNLQ